MCSVILLLSLVFIVFVLFLAMVCSLFLILFFVRAVGTLSIDLVSKEHEHRTSNKNNYTEQNTTRTQGL